MVAILITGICVELVRHTCVQSANQVHASVHAAKICNICVELVRHTCVQSANQVHASVHAAKICNLYLLAGCATLHLDELLMPIINNNYEYFLTSQRPNDIWSTVLIDTHSTI